MRNELDEVAGTTLGASKKAALRWDSLQVEDGFVIHFRPYRAALVSCEA